MTQRIFKKSNKQDMIDLFNVLPDWVEKIKTKYIEEDKQEFLLFIGNKNWYNIAYKLENDILNIDFETDDIEEMIIERPM